MTTLREKVSVYEGLLHKINMAAAVTMNPERVASLIQAISDWSYAHRVGNGSLSDRQQKAAIKEAFDRIKTA